MIPRWSWADPLNSPDVSASAVVIVCQKLLQAGDMNDVIRYLEIVASNAIACPDRCGQWAEYFFDCYEDEIVTENFVEIRHG